MKLISAVASLSDPQHSIAWDGGASLTAEDVTC